MTLTLKDPAYGKEEYCKGNTECENLFPPGSTGLEGSATIYVRPYTFALCDITSSAQSNSDYSGTSRDGPGFAAAGEPFEVRLKPVIWLAGDSADTDYSGDGTKDIKTTGTGWCARQVTENYYAPGDMDTAIVAPVSLSIPALPASPDQH